MKLNDSNVSQHKKRRARNRELIIRNPSKLDITTYVRHSQDASFDKQLFP